jgi:RimJ/RimL family protein N-acetyltransferase
VNIPVIETNRLILREWRESDLDGYAKFRMDPVVAKFITPSDTVHAAWREMVYNVGHWVMRGFGVWCLERKDTREAIGFCGPYYPHGWPEPEIGWGIYPDHQRHGFATEAAIASLRFAYETLQWRTAISLIANENSRSIALAERLGARAESPFTRRDFDCTIYRHLNPTDFQKHSKENISCH